MPIFDDFFERPAVRIKDAFILCFFYPIFASISAIFSLYALIVTHSVVVGLHILDAINKWNVVRRLRNKTRRGKERIDSLIKEVKLAIRLFIVSLILFSVHMTVVAFFLSIWSIFNAIFRKDDSVLGRVIRGIINKVSVLLFGVPLTTFGSKANGDNSHHGTSGEQRSTSLKSCTNGRCVVINEGPHFNQTARGFIGRRSM